MWSRGPFDFQANFQASVLPLEQYGISLHKGEFIDAICLRYGFTPSLLPSHCVCGKDFTLSHILSCPHSAFSIIRHNEVRDLTARFDDRSVSQGVWFVYITAPSLMYVYLTLLQLPVDPTILAAALCKHEAEKQCACEERMHEVEHGSFTLLVFSSGEMGKVSTTMHL